MILTKLIPVKYRGINYPSHIKCLIQELAGNFDKDIIEIDSPYSLHTEYSYMKRNFNSSIIKDLVNITSAQKDNIPQLWYNNNWANEFSIFLDRLINSSVSPEILEIHPPFKDYCNSFEQFLDVYMVFLEKFRKKHPKTIILIENRCGTMYKNGKFLLSRCADVIKFCNILKETSVDLKIVLDYPQIFSAELIKMDNVDLKKIIKFNEELINYKEFIGGFHIWGKRKSENGRWAPHTGNLNTFFSNNNELKKIFLMSVLNTFNDDNERYFVPEVNSGEDDLLSIVTDMEQAGFIFRSETTNVYQLIRIKWENEHPFFELYNREKNEVICKDALGNISLNILPVKYCLGSYELGTHKYIPCKNNSVVQEQKICKDCDNLNGFKFCVSCRGENCITSNKAALEYCNHKHFVYLAYFPEQIIKVGTAHELRKEERLLEQGALYRMLIAELPTGRLARQIEKEISKFGYKTSVSSKYKIQNIIFSKNEQDIRQILKTEFNNIRQNINNEYKNYLLKDCIFYNNSSIVQKIKSAFAQTKKVQLSLFDDVFKPQHEIISNVTGLTGEILVFIGTIALIKDTKNHLYAFDFKEIFGNNIIL